MRKSLTLAAVLFVVACGSLENDMAANQCDAAQWKGFGFEDGVRGMDAGSFGARNGDCDPAANDIRRERYMAGYADGVARFCTAENGYNQGATGYVYKGICPIALEDTFVKALKEGHRAAQRQKVAGTI